MVTISGPLPSGAPACLRPFPLLWLAGHPWRTRPFKGIPPSDDTEPAGSLQAPRCEAWTLTRHDRPADRCPNPGTYWRNGRRVCMAHKNARWVAFDRATAEQLSRPR